MSAAGQRRLGPQDEVARAFDVASTVRLLIVIVLPRDQFGNLEGETFKVST